MAACRAAVRIAAGNEGDRLRADLTARVAQFREGLRALDMPATSESHIQPIVLGDERRTMAVAEELLTHGVYAQGIRPPTVPRGTSRLRVALMATHTAGDVERLLGCLEESLRK